MTSFLSADLITNEYSFCVLINRYAPMTKRTEMMLNLKQFHLVRLKDKQIFFFYQRITLRHFIKYTVIRNKSFFFSRGDLSRYTFWSSELIIIDESSLIMIRNLFLFPDESFKALLKWSNYSPRCLLHSKNNKIFLHTNKFLWVFNRVDSQFLHNEGAKHDNLSLPSIHRDVPTSPAKSPVTKPEK